MKILHLKRCWRSIKVTPTAILVWGILFCTGYAKIACYLLSILFLHELGHCIVILVLGYEIRTLTLHPYGCSIVIWNECNTNYIDDLLITIGGPLMFFVIFKFIELLWNLNLLSRIGYQYLLSANINLLVFNCLPIFPLDGGRCMRDICCIIIGSITGEIMASVLSIGLSILAISLFPLWFQVVFVIIILYNLFQIYEMLQFLPYRKVIESTK